MTVPTMLERWSALCEKESALSPSFMTWTMGCREHMDALLLERYTLAGINYLLDENCSFAGFCKGMDGKKYMNCNFEQFEFESIAEAILLACERAMGVSR